MHCANALVPPGQRLCNTAAVQVSCKKTSPGLPTEGLRKAKRQEKSLHPPSFTGRELVSSVREEAKENRVTPRVL